MTEAGAAVAPLTITLFGPLSVLVQGQPIPHLRSRKAQWMLALLTLRHGRPVKREWLAGTLWPDVDQTQAFAALRPALSELRKALGEEGTRLQSPSRHFLLLDLAGADVDVATFDTALARKTTDGLEKAVSLYRGQLLEGCAEEWVVPERVARQQECLRALQTLATETAASSPAKAIDCWRRAVALDPLWEVPRRGLMELLAKIGDSNAALGVYRDLLTLLQREDPRAAPEDETTALYRRLREHARGKASSAAFTTAASVREETAAPSVTGSLNHPLTELIGREDECREVTERLRRSHLLTLTGPGGIGKTRLALQIASDIVAEYPDGAWLVALDALTDGQQVSGQIFSVLRLKEAPGKTLLQTVTERLRGKRLLLVLDNCEHVLASTAEVARQLLRECDGVRILATSREALGIAGESVWPVPPLSVPEPDHLPPGKAARRQVLLGYESVQLFLERAQAVQQTFALTGENAQAVAWLCSHLEGIPLAIELAAARVRALTVEQITERMQNHSGSFRLLTGGNRSASSRQQTLRGALDWSYELLSHEEQKLLQHLSVFTGGWSLAAAERVCGEAGDAKISDLLTSLVNKSLVLALEVQSAKTDRRYRLQEMVRQYAAAGLEASGEAPRVKDRHQAYFAAFGEEAGSQLTGPDQEQWLERLETEHNNLRSALTWRGEDPGAIRGLRLAGALWRFWLVRGYFSEGRHYLEELLGRAGPRAAPADRAKALNGAANLCYYQGEYTRAREFYEESLSLFRAVGGNAECANVLNSLGNLSKTQGDLIAARALHEESLRLSEVWNDLEGSADSLNCLGNVAFSSGDYALARSWYEKSLLLYEQFGDRGSVAVLLGNLGNVARLMSEFDLARTRLEESLNVLRELGDRLGIARTMGNLGDVVWRNGSYETGWALLEESLSLYNELGDIRGRSSALNRLATAARFRGDDAGAWAGYEESLRLRIKIGDKAGVAHILNEVGILLAAQGRTQKAVRLWGAAYAIQQDMGTRVSPLEKTEYDQQISQARRTLGQETFAAQWDSGIVLTQEQAAIYALDQTL
ncbi:MAG: tetratricopeptide repeat protein [Akkermansiaceae bacterium]|nr:tetratricopeptide repeat protein [Armatimonadota bacterium]